MRYTISFICIMFIFGFVSKTTYSQELKSQEELAFLATQLYNENYDLRSKLHHAESEIQELTLTLEFERILIKVSKGEITSSDASVEQEDILKKLNWIQFAKMAGHRLGTLNRNMHNSVLLPRPPFTDIYKR